MTCISDVRGTNSHVSFLIRALKSSIIANFQCGLDNASFGLRGTGEGVVEVVRLNGFFGLEIPDMLRVVILLDGRVVWAWLGSASWG